MDSSKLTRFPQFIDALRNVRGLVHLSGITVIPFELTVRGEIALV